LAAIYGSVYLLPWKMNFTPRVNLPQVKNHCLRISAAYEQNMTTLVGERILQISFKRSAHVL